MWLGLIWLRPAWSIEQSENARVVISLAFCKSILDTLKGSRLSPTRGYYNSTVAQRHIIMEAHIVVNRLTLESSFKFTQLNSCIPHPSRMWTAWLSQSRTIIAWVGVLLSLTPSPPPPTLSFPGFAIVTVMCQSQLVMWWQLILCLFEVQFPWGYFHVMPLEKLLGQGWGDGKLKQTKFRWNAITRLTLCARVYSEFMHWLFSYCYTPLPGSCLLLKAITTPTTMMAITITPINTPMVPPAMPPASEPAAEPAYLC